MSLIAPVTFCFGNKNTLSFHSDGPFPFCLKQLMTTIPQIPADIDLSGQTVLVTGANSGIGFQSARLYVKHKARVIFGVRNVQKGESAAQKIREEFQSAEIKVMKVDMESFEVMKTFAEELHRTEPRVDIAVLNAGICQYRTSVSATGYDTHLQVCFSIRRSLHTVSH
jgi:NADPH:quinone reductase-like Zn-dependent oxidoreductase